MNILDYEVKMLPYHFVLFYNLSAGDLAVYRKFYRGTEADNALLMYCYLDSSCGLSYKAMCWAYVSDDGKVEYHHARKMEASLTMREGSLNCDAIVLDEDDMMLFKDEAEQIKECYGYMKDRTVIHEDIPFDDYRHPAHPEAIYVYFLPRGNPEKYERIWVTEKERHPDGTLEGELMDDPFNPLMGVHKGELVHVFPLRGEGDDDFVLPVARLPWMKNT